MGIAMGFNCYFQWNCSYNWTYYKYTGYFKFGQLHTLHVHLRPNDEHRMEEVKLKRKFNLVQSIAILTGLVIETGIYVSPTYAMRMIAIPGVTICMWIVAGCINILVSLIFAELGTTYTTIGDCYVYLNIFYGDFVSFMFMWSCLFLSRTGSNALKTLLAGS